MCRHDARGCPFVGEEGNSFALTQIVNASELLHHLLWYLPFMKAIVSKCLALRDSAEIGHFRHFLTVQVQFVHALQ
jgi:hypothetical protein